MDKKSIKPAKTIVFVLLACLVLAAPLLILSRTTHPVFIFRHTAFVVKTSSMQPEFDINSLVIVQKVSIGDVIEGDVIAFNSTALGGKLALHRVSGVAENGLRTKGDANALEDGQTIDSSNFVGVCVYKTGAIPLFSFHGWFFLAFVPLSVLATAIMVGQKLYRKGFGGSKSGLGGLRKG